MPPRRVCRLGGKEKCTKIRFAWNQSGNRKCVKRLTNGNAAVVVTEEEEEEEERDRQSRQLTKSEELWQMTNQAGNGRKKRAGERSYLVVPPTLSNRS